MLCALQEQEKNKNKSHHDDLWPQDGIIVKIVEKKEVLVTLPKT